MAFKDNFKIIRDFRNKKQADVAEGTGISKQNISNWANGLNEPSSENLDLLAKFLDIPREVFYMETLTDGYLKSNFLRRDNTSVQEAGDNKQNGMDPRETFYTDLMEKNEHYSIIPTAVLKDYKIVPDKIIDVIISSNENEKKALRESKDMEIESLMKKYELIIEGLENKTKRLEGEKAEIERQKKALEEEIAGLRRKIPTNQQ